MQVSTIVVTNLPTRNSEEPEDPCPVPGAVDEREEGDKNSKDCKKHADLQHIATADEE